MFARSRKHWISEILPRPAACALRGFLVVAAGIVEAGIRSVGKGLQRLFRQRRLFLYGDGQLWKVGLTYGEAVFQRTYAVAVLLDEL